MNEKIIKNNNDKRDYLKNYYKIRNTLSVSSMYILLHLREHKTLLNSLVLKDVSLKYKDENLDGLIYKLEIKDDGDNFFIDYIGDVEKSGDEIINDLINLSSVVSKKFSIYLYIDMEKLNRELKGEDNTFDIVEDEYYMTDEYFSFLKEKSRILKEVDDLLLNYNGNNSDKERLNSLKEKLYEIKIYLDKKDNYIKEFGIYLKDSLELYSGRIFN